MDIGDVIRIFDNSIQPPKVKYLIIVATTPQQAATIFINTDHRPEHLSSDRLQALQVLLTTENCPFLKYTSHADCAEITERDKSKINEILQKDPGRKEKPIPVNVMNTILLTVKRSKTISVATKKKFNLI